MKERKLPAAHSQAIVRLFLRRTLLRREIRGIGPLSIGLGAGFAACTFSQSVGSPSAVLTQLPLLVTPCPPGSKGYRGCSRPPLASLHPPPPNRPQSLPAATWWGPSAATCLVSKPDSKVECSRDPTLPLYHPFTQGPHWSLWWHLDPSPKPGLSSSFYGFSGGPFPQIEHFGLCLGPPSPPSAAWCPHLKPTHGGRRCFPTNPKSGFLQGHNGQIYT